MAKTRDQGHILSNHIYKTSVEKATNTGFVILLNIHFWQLNLQNGYAHKSSLFHISVSKKIFNLSKFQTTYIHQVYILCILVYFSNLSHFGTRMIGKYIEKYQN